MLAIKNVTTQTVKVQILPDDEQIEIFRHSQKCFVDECNFISSYIFEHDNCLDLKITHNATYHEIRDAYGIPSQIAQYAIREVIATYKTILTKMSNSSSQF